MVFAGLDPTGGAGIQADVEAIASMGAHAAPLPTAITTQDTHRVQGLESVDPTALIAQARGVLEDMPVAACKLGLLPDAGVIEAVHSILLDWPHIPVVLDPVLASGAGDTLVDDDVPETLRSLILPLTTVATPNSLEARALARGADTLAAAAHALMSLGTRYVLITGAHEEAPEVVNTLYSDGRVVERFHWERLPHSYHGSGCTLASAIAGLLAQGLEPFTAVHEAQEYTWKALEAGYRIGGGQHIPNRFFWAREEAVQE